MEGLEAVPDSFHAVVEHTRRIYAILFDQEEPDDGELVGDDDLDTSDEQTDEQPMDDRGAPDESEEVTEPSVVVEPGSEAGEYTPRTSKAEYFAFVEGKFEVELSDAISFVEETEPERKAEDEWVCLSCGKTFRRQPAANARHQRACERRQRDERDLPHECPRCGKRFKTEQALRSHIGRSHRN